MGHQKLSFKLPVFVTKFLHGTSMNSQDFSSAGNGWVVIVSPVRRYKIYFPESSLATQKLLKRTQLSVDIECLLN